MRSVTFVNGQWKKPVWKCPLDEKFNTKEIDTVE